MDTQSHQMLTSALSGALTDLTGIEPGLKDRDPEVAGILRQGLARLRGMRKILAELEPKPGDVGELAARVATDPTLRTALRSLRIDLEELDRDVDTSPECRVVDRALINLRCAESVIAFAAKDAPAEEAIDAEAIKHKLDELAAVADALYIALLATSESRMALNDDSAMRTACVVWEKAQDAQSAAEKWIAAGARS